MTDLRLPPYGAGTIAELLPSVAAGLGVRGYADVLGLGDADRVVVILVDGLGRVALQRHTAITPVLSGLTSWASGLSTGFPSTTTVSLGSLGTGLPPGAHGLVGTVFWLPEADRTLSPLGWRDDPNPIATQPEPTVLERVAAAGVAVTTVSPRSFEQSGLTRAALRGARYRGADGLGERVGEVCAALAAPGRSLVYVYLGDLDKTGHVHGQDSEHWRTELALVDRFVELLCAAVGPATRIVLTADHGMVDCPDSERVDLDADPALNEGLAVLAGEPRARYGYARPGAAADLVAAWQERLAGLADVLSRDDAVARGLFGEVEPGLVDRIGDVIAIARGQVVLASPRTDPVISGLRGQHGALSEAEYAVPLLLWGP
ncbi:MAG: alkaline phosphatase family protein [Actinomycetota bacterium]|nr:MAG: alkaline phosphatase family protein [Actinomycetota bacterium]